MQAGRRDCARKDQGVVHGRHASKDIDAESARADGRANRRDPDAHDGGDAHTREDDAGGERQFDQPQQLALRHPHSSAGLAHRGINPRNPGVRIAHDWQQRVDDERADRGPRADPKHRNQQTEQRQTRDRLEHVRQSQHRPAPGGTSSYQDTERQTDECRDGGGDRHQADVLPQEQPHFARVAGVKLE